VSRNWPMMNKSEISHEILAYLVEHPEAQDTVEGIVEWWLLERQIKFQTAKVKEVLSELVAKGLIIEHKGLNSRTRYRVNRSKHGEIKKLFRHKPH
jgi:hypothetical protein